MCSSGISIITKSAPLTASATSLTASPAFFALSHDAPPRRSPTVAHDRDLTALDERQIRILVVIHLHDLPSRVGGGGRRGSGRVRWLSGPRLSPASSRLPKL